ncbi:MAG: phosphoesterase [Rhizobiales bacterium]|nr:phosphoesterase [Hyphomicrobiales bacterium]
MPARRKVLTAAAGLVAVLGAGTCFYTVHVEPHWLEEVHLPMPVKRLPPHLEGRRLVQLSDIHVGRRVDDDYVLTVFDRVRALEPDILVITGDFVSHHRRIVDQAAAIYRRLPLGRLATVAILGNHDYGDDARDVGLGHALHGIFEDAGMTVLKNQGADIEGLRLIGLDDRWGPFFDPAPIMATVEPGSPAIVLSHNPDTADMPFWGGFDGWILAGHTHGGQCKPPLFRPPLLPVHNKSYVAGRYDLSGGRTMYINRGIGHLIQARFNARPEITVFSLTSASAPLGA